MIGRSYFLLLTHNVVIEFGKVGQMVNNDLSIVFLLSTGVIIEP